MILTGDIIDLANAHIAAINRMEDNKQKKKIFSFFFKSSNLCYFYNWRWEEEEELIDL